MTDRDMQTMFDMQEEAKKRVMDMQSRSRFAAEQMNRDLSGGAQPTAQTTQKREPKPVPAHKNDAFAHMDREELEKLFLLSLCLLLSQEEADRDVILALLYLLT